MFLEVLKAIFFGIVEGITEWLPISSTGHLILLEEFFTLDVTKDFWDFFLVAIQFGAVLAVCVTFFRRLNPFSKGKDQQQRKATLRLWGLVVVGCIPAGLIGVFLDELLDTYCYNFFVVAAALLAYGVLFVVLERRFACRAVRIPDVEALSVRDAFLIGCFQVLSLIPGTSRSGSTILGASLIGVGRSAAAEFSFLMALPIIAAATLLRGYNFFKSGAVMGSSEILTLVVGVVVAFSVSLAVIRFLMDFIRRHSFEVFGWYRIVLSVMLLLYGLVKVLA